MASVCHFLPYRGPHGPLDSPPPHAGRRRGGSRSRDVDGVPGLLEASTGQPPHPRARALKVAEELGYVPNPTAQALGSGRTRTIALLVPDITNPYFSGVIKGAERAAAAAGLTLVLGDTAENPTAEAELVRRLERAVDGFVISASRLTDDELRGAAERSPIALVNRATPGLGCVVADFDAGHPADRRPPRVLRPPIVRLRRWPGRVVVRSPPLAGAAGRRGRAGHGRPGGSGPTCRPSEVVRQPPTRPSPRARPPSCATTTCWPSV